MHEINLLPPSRRSRLKQQWLRLTVLQFLRHVQIGLGIVAALGVVAGGTLQVLVLVAPNTAEVTLTQLISRYQAARQEVVQKNQVLGEIAATGTQRTIWSNNLAELFGALPPGTTIRTIQSVGTPPKLTFSGRSVNRNSLIIFQSRLEQFSWAQSVTSPLQNLLDRDNPDYSFTITVKTPQSQTAQ